MDDKVYFCSQGDYKCPQCRTMERFFARVWSSTYTSPSLKNQVTKIENQIRAIREQKPESTSATPEGYTSMHVKDQPPEFKPHYPYQDKTRAVVLDVAGAASSHPSCSWQRVARGQQRVSHAHQLMPQTPQQYRPAHLTSFSSKRYNNCSEIQNHLIKFRIPKKPRKDSEYSVVGRSKCRMDGSVPLPIHIPLNVAEDFDNLVKRVGSLENSHGKGNIDDNSESDNPLNMEISNESQNGVEKDEIASDSVIISRNDPKSSSSDHVLLIAAYARYLFLPSVVIFLFFHKIYFFRCSNLVSCLKHSSSYNYFQVYTHIEM